MMKFNKKFKKSIIIFFIISFFSINNIIADAFFDYPISTLILDAGHGGLDSGAIASYSFNDDIKEKDIVLSISKKIENYVHKSLPSLKIIQTRKDDTFLSLQERSEMGYNFILDDKTSSIFISIHANSALNKNASGFEIYTKLENKIVYLYDETTLIENIDLFVNENLSLLNEKQYLTSLDLASSILTSFVQDFPKTNNRGIKSEDLYVLNVCRTTAVLVEVGFISNEEEAKKLLDESYQDEIAKSISKGIVEYIKNRR